MQAMRKFILVLASLALLFVTPTALATDKQNHPDLVKLGSTETVNKDYFAFGNRVEISGTVNGDVYAAAGTVFVDGKVNGDLLVAGGTVTINGTVTQDVRVGTGNLTVTGKIGGNLTVGGGNVEVTNSAEIAGSILAGAGNLNLSGKVGKSIKVGAGSLRIDSSIGGDVEASVGSLALASKAVVGGNVTYWSDKDAFVDIAAKVTGQTVKKVPPQESRIPPLRLVAFLEGVKTILRIISFVSTLVLGLLLLKLLPKFLETTKDNINKKPLASFVTGLVGLFAWPVVAVLLLITIVGLPLGLIALVGYTIAVWISKIFVINWLGAKIFEQTTKKTSPYWAYIVGIIVFYLIGWLPILGGIETVLALIFGLGTLLLTKKDIYFAARSKNII